jgi:hypothetical protein
VQQYKTAVCCHEGRDLLGPKEMAPEGMYDGTGRLPFRKGTWIPERHRKNCDQENCNQAPCKLSSPGMAYPVPGWFYF